MLSLLRESVLNDPFLRCYISVAICMEIWLCTFEILNIEEYIFDKSGKSIEPCIVTLIIGGILFGISAIITFKYSMNVYSLFFLIGGMQIGLYPILVLENSNGDTFGSYTATFWVLEIFISVIIYGLFNPSI